MIDKMREEFEAWFKAEAKNVVLTDTIKDSNGNYYFAETRLLWQAWQASRAAVVIKFTDAPYFCPSKTEIEQASDNGYADALSMVKQAITEAGVKYE